MTTIQEMFQQIKCGSPAIRLPTGRFLSLGEDCTLGGVDTFIRFNECFDFQVIAIAPEFRSRNLNEKGVLIKPLNLRRKGTLEDLAKSTDYLASLGLELDDDYESTTDLIKDLLKAYVINGKDNNADTWYRAEVDKWMSGPGISSAAPASVGPAPAPIEIRPSIAPDPDRNWRQSQEKVRALEAQIVADNAAAGKKAAKLQEQIASISAESSASEDEKAAILRESQSLKTRISELETSAQGWAAEEAKLWGDRSPASFWKMLGVSSGEDIASELRSPKREVTPARLLAAFQWGCGQVGGVESDADLLSLALGEVRCAYIGESAEVKPSFGDIEKSGSGKDRDDVMSLFRLVASASLAGIGIGSLFGGLKKRDGESLLPLWTKGGWPEFRFKQNVHEKFGVGLVWISRENRMLAECDGESDDDSDSDFEVASFKEHAVAIFRSGATMSSWKASLYKGDNTEGQYRSNPWRSFRRDGINWKFSSLKALGAEWANSANPNIAETEFELSGQGSISEHLADLITDA